MRGLLAHLGLAERTQGLLVWSLERMRTQGVETVRAQLNGEQDDLPLDPSLLEGLDDAQATALLLHTLQAMQIKLNYGTRAPEAIVSRLVRKLRRDDAQPRIEQALEVLTHLGQIRGAPDYALPAATALLTEHQLPTTALDELEAILTLLVAYDLPQERIILDFGMGRGLQYYTGLIFELYDANQMQLCGGGRYDDLVLSLGGRQAVPAVALPMDWNALRLPASAFPRLHLQQKCWWLPLMTAIIPMRSRLPGDCVNDPILRPSMCVGER